MSTFSLTPEALRALAAAWQHDGRAVGSLTFDAGVVPATGCTAADALRSCARAAAAAAGDYGGDVQALGAAVHRFAVLAQTADADAAAGILAASRP